jgi:hypothetical protein
MDDGQPSRAEPDLAEALELRDELLIACRQVLLGVGTSEAFALVAHVDALLDLDDDASPGRSAEASRERVCRREALPASFPELTAFLVRRGRAAARSSSARFHTQRIRLRMPGFADAVNTKARRAAWLRRCMGRIVAEVLVGLRRRSEVLLEGASNPRSRRAGNRERLQDGRPREIAQRSG